MPNERVRSNATTVDDFLTRKSDRGRVTSGLKTSHHSLVAVFWPTMTSERAAPPPRAPLPLTLTFGVFLAFYTKYRNRRRFSRFIRELRPRSPPPAGVGVTESSKT